MKKRKKILARHGRLPDRSSDLLVNQRMLYAVRDELKADIRSHDHRFDAIEARFDSFEAKIDAKFDAFEAKMDAKFEAFEAKMDAKFEAFEAKMDAKFEAFEAKMDAKFEFFMSKIDSRLEKMQAEIHRTLCLVEEQENRNRAVLDGYQSIYDRQDRVERKVEEHDRILVKKSLPGRET